MIDTLFKQMTFEENHINLDIRERKKKLGLAICDMLV